MAITLNRVDVEWRKGDDGLGGTFTFSPRPRISRDGTVQKFAEFQVPLKSGSDVQLLNDKSRRFRIRGILVLRGDPNYDDLDELRRDLLSGIGTGAGQLHFISNKGQANSKHLFYKAFPTSIEFSVLRNSKFLFYTINILLADPTEFEI